MWRLSREENQMLTRPSSIGYEKFVGKRRQGPVSGFSRSFLRKSRVFWTALRSKVNKYLIYIKNRELRSRQ